MIVRQAPPEHLPWLLARIRYAPTADVRALEAVGSDGRIGGMVGLDAWRPGSVQMHVAIERPEFARVLVRPVFDWVFNQAGCAAALGMVPSNRPEGVLMAERLGFRLVHRVLGGWARGIDLLIFEMRRADCRWLKGERHERLRTTG